MTGLLDGGLQSIMGAAFAGVYTAATLTRPMLVSDGQGGFTTGDPAEFDIRVQRNDWSAYTRQELNVPAKDARFFILQSTAGTTPRAEDKFVHAGQTWKVVAVAVEDPASVYWTAHVTPA